MSTQVHPGNARHHLSVNYGATADLHGVHIEYPYAERINPDFLYALILYEYALPDIRPISVQDDLFAPSVASLVHVDVDEQGPDFRYISKPVSFVLLSVHVSLIVPAVVHCMAVRLIG